MTIPKVALVHDKKEIALALITLSTVLYFGITTAFVQNGTVNDTITGSILSMQLLALYIWFPIGFFLWTAIVWGYRKNVFIGLFMTVLFGMHAISMMLLPLGTLLFGGSIVGAFIIVLTMVKVGYEVLHEKVKTVQRIWKFFVVFFIAMVLAMVIDFCLGFFNQYQMVASHALNNMPENIDMSVGAPFSVHVMLWHGVIILVILSIVDVVQKKPVTE